MTAQSSHKPASADPAGKRERILAAAETCFAKSGFFGARIAEIAKQAGVADGTIYLYFRSKDDLLISWFEWRMEQVVPDLAATIEAAGDDARAQLAAFIRRYLEMVVENPEAAGVMNVELRGSSKFMKEYENPRFGDFLKLLASVIARGQANGVLDPAVPPTHAARAIFGALDELALSWLLGGGEKFDIVRAAAWVTRMTLSGLVAGTDVLAPDNT